MRHVSIAESSQKELLLAILSCCIWIFKQFIILELFPLVNFLIQPGQVTHVFGGTPNYSII